MDNICFKIIEFINGKINEAMTGVEENLAKAKDPECKYNEHTGYTIAANDYNGQLTALIAVKSMILEEMENYIVSQYGDTNRQP